MTPVPAERTAFRRGFVAGALVLSLASTGQLVLSQGSGSTLETPDSAPLVAYALDQVTPDLQLVQVGKWLARALFDKDRPSHRRCG